MSRTVGSWWAASAVLALALALALITSVTGRASAVDGVSAAAGGHHWVTVGFEESIPVGAVVGGYEYDKDHLIRYARTGRIEDVGPRRPIYICRIRHEGHLIVGKGLDRWQCFVEYKGQSVGKAPYEVLIGDATWVRSAGANRLPTGAIRGGRSKAGADVYICRSRLTLDKSQLGSLAGSVKVSEAEIGVLVGGMAYNECKLQYHDLNVVDKQFKHDILVSD